MANAKIKTLVGVCLGIVLAASQASAECAWVLWNEISGEVQKEWVVIQAMPSAEDCDGNLKVKIKDFAKDAKFRVEDNIVSQLLGAKVVIYRFVCLPDTIDPRGVKGR